MCAQDKTTDAVELLHQRYTKGNVEREASLERERVNAQVARMIHDLRIEAGLTQKELADLVETTQSVISRLEDADYEGHSLSILNRVASALKQRLLVEMTAKDPEMGTVRYAFHLVVQMLRRQQGLTVEQLAARTGIDREAILALERRPGTKPTPLMVCKLSQFFKIPERRFLALAGAVREVPQDIAEHASRFAAQSESFSSLTKEEKRVLDDFMRCLKAEA